MEDDNNNPSDGSTNSLTIYAQSTGSSMGKLSAIGHGIGGYGGDCGTVTINGGVIEAVSGDAAGIGGEHDHYGGTITINGGFVASKSNSNGAGIGGGLCNANGSSSCGTVSINGGTVIANGYGGAAGIGGGSYPSGSVIMGGNGGKVTITGGTVIATGGNGGAGIGGGVNASDNGTFSTGSDGNAVIFASSISHRGNESNWSGVIFEGSSEGKVFGSPTLNSDLAIPDGTGETSSYAKTLTVPSDSTLTIAEGKTLTVPSSSTLSVKNGGVIANKGTITKYGTLDNQGTITNSDIGSINGNGSLNGSGTITSMLTLNTDSGSLDDSCGVPGSYTENENNQSITLPTAEHITKAGYDFKGWFEKTGVDENGVVVLSSAPTQAFTVDYLRAKAFYAKWEAKPASIAFEANGGSDVQAVGGTTDATISDRTMPTTSRAGYSFAGWYDNASFNGSPVLQLPERFPAGTTTYYAKWNSNYVPPAVPQATTDVIKMINALPAMDDITLEDGETIAAARESYDALTDYQKSFVPAASVTKLEAAEDRYADLVAVAPVEDALEALVDAEKLKTKDAKKAVKKAQAALAEYSSLTDGQKALVDEALIANAQEVVVKGAILVAKADKKAIGKVKNKAFSVKAGTTKSIYFKTLLSAAGTKVTYKKASGSKYITVSKTGKVTAKKGMKEDKTYTAKLKVTCGKSWKYVKVTVKVRG